MFAPVPQHDGKHSNKALDGSPKAPLLDCCQHHLSVRMSSEPVACCLKLPSQRLKVIDLAVEYDDQPPTLRHHRLVPKWRQVYDSQAAEPERHPVLAVRP